MSEIYDTDSYDAGHSSGDISSAESAPPSGDTGEYGAEVDPETGEPGPVPYTRFKESRDELRDVRHRLEDMQGDFERNRKLVEQQQAQIEHYANLASQLSRSQEERKRDSEAFEDDDPYADPMEKRIRQLERLIEGSSKTSTDRVAQLESQLQEQVRSQRQASLEREYNERVDMAMTKYPRASRNDIETDMFRSKKVDKRAVEHFAKRSQEKMDEAFRRRLRAEGYREPPKRMLQASAPGAQRKDFGDDLEAAHAGALEALLGSNH